MTLPSLFVPAANVSQVEFAFQLANGNLHFADASSTQANGSVTPSFLVPVPFRPGRSVVHLDPDFSGPDELMLPSLSRGIVVHTPSGVDLGILNGIGWTTEQDSPAPVPEPATILLLGSGLAGLLVGRRRFRRS